MDRQEMMARAEELGLEFKKNISNADLEKLIENAEFEAKEKAIKEAESKAGLEVKPSSTKKENVIDKKAARREALKLKRVIITPLDERMRTLPSEMYSVGNKNVGFIKKVVRFGVETLEPVIILNHLKEKKALIQQTNMVNGMPVTTKRMAPAFSIQELPDLTEEEFRELKEKK